MKKLAMKQEIMEKVLQGEEDEHRAIEMELAEITGDGGPDFDQVFRGMTPIPWLPGDVQVTGLEFAAILAQAQGDGAPFDDAVNKCRDGRMTESDLQFGMDLSMLMIRQRLTTAREYAGAVPRTCCLYECPDRGRHAPQSAARSH